MNRSQWKKYHRLSRVTRRETKKAERDMILYGTGTVLLLGDGSDPRRIHPAEMRIETSPDGKMLKLELASIYGEFNGC